MYFPHFFLKAGNFEFKELIVPLLQIIIFGMGSQMSVKDFAGVIKIPKGVLIGLFCQFTIMPIIGVTIALEVGMQNGGLASGRLTNGKSYNCWFGTGSLWTNDEYYGIFIGYLLAVK